MRKEFCLRVMQKYKLLQTVHNYQKKHVASMGGIYNLSVFWGLFIWFTPNHNVHIQRYKDALDMLSSTSLNSLRVVFSDQSGSDHLFVKSTHYDGRSHNKLGWHFRFSKMSTYFEAREFSCNWLAVGFMIWPVWT